MALLDATHYSAIRAAIDPSLDEESLPGEIIALSIYMDAAVAEVVAKVPDAEDLEGEDLVHVQNAAILLTAARLATRVPNVTSETYVEGGGYQRKDVDRVILAKDLRGQAQDELAMVLQTGEVETSRPSLFALASGTRGA